LRNVRSSPWNCTRDASVALTHPGTRAGPPHRAAHGQRDRAAGEPM